MSRGRQTGTDQSSALLVNLATGNIALRQNEQRVVPVASVAKMMVAATLLRRGLPFDRATLQQYLCHSTNSLSSTIATRAGLNSRTFVAAMNETAQALGMTTARFHGMNGSGTMSAEDAARLMHYVYSARNAHNTEPGQFMRDFMSPRAGVGHRMSGFAFPDDRTVGGKDGEWRREHAMAIVRIGADNQPYAIFTSATTQDRARSLAQNLIGMTQNEWRLSQQAGTLSLTGTGQMLALGPRPTPDHPRGPTAPRGLAQAEPGNDFTLS